jgi:hypothetical protein
VTAKPSGGKGEICYWFLVTSVPAGGAPAAIRSRWVGVPLPVRQPRPIEGPEAHVARNVRDRQVAFIPDGVAVEPGDAVKALRWYGRLEAADWWEAHVRSHPATVALAFRAGEGQLLPVSLALMRFPELEDFDLG